VLVLVVDDEPSVRQSLSRALRLEGYDVVTADDGVAALAAVEQRHPDVVVLDVGLPVMDGLTACRRLRERGDRTPVLMLTARDAVEDRVDGLDAGADDYLVKPFALRELTARLRALVRRAAPAGADLLRYADLSMDPAAHRAYRGTRELGLTRTEYVLLELFLRNAEQVLPREVILDRVWGFDFEPTSNSLEVFVGYLRRKLETVGEPRLVQTVRGVGYVLRRA
jgi:two-component system, OmpR family, response regulator MprA